MKSLNALGATGAPRLSSSNGEQLLGVKPLCAVSTSTITLPAMRPVPFLICACCNFLSERGFYNPHLNADNQSGTRHICNLHPANARAIAQPKCSTPLVPSLYILSRAFYHREFGFDKCTRLHL